MRQRKGPTVDVAPKFRQPTKKELEEPINTDATLEELTRMVLTPIRVVEEHSEKSNMKTLLKEKYKE